MSLENAYAHLRAGGLAQAEAELRRVVDSRPGQAEALELLGIVLAQQGRAYEALGQFDRAIAIRPDAAGARHNRAQALFALGRAAEARAELDAVVAAWPDLHAAWNLLGSVLAAQGDPKAEQAYGRALTLRPDHPETHYNLGVFFMERGQLEEAIACYRKAVTLRAHFVAAHNNLANALRARGRLDEALTHYAQAVQLEPQFADGWSNYGAGLREAGRVEEAIPALERAVALAPHGWSAVSNLGVAYLARNRFEEAIACQRRALELRPDSHEVLGHLGNALAGAGRWEEAEASYRAAIDKRPEYADAHNNLGTLRMERGDIDGAQRSLRRALEVQADFPAAISNLGLLLQDEGRTEEAIELYRRALALDPRAARPAYNLGIALLSRFEFAEGWPLTERRYDTIPPITLRRAFTVPRLEPGDFGCGHRIAVWREQGVGDQILYATLLAELAARGEDFVAEVDRRLVPAFARAHPGWKVAAPEQSAAAFAGCARHIPAGSLPGMMRLSLESFGAQPARLLAADAARAQEYRKSLSAGPGELVVGISWRSFQPKVRGELSKRKSAPLAAFHVLSLAEGVKLLDLQYGDTAGERGAFGADGGRLERLEGLDLFNDLDGVMAAIEACDVVVTTSNVTAHLAGALGKRTLLVFLRARPPLFYWTSPHGRSLWYPSVEIASDAGVETWDQALRRSHEFLRG